jgi:hypothetical protein
LLGGGFVNWVLAGGYPPFTSAQQEVVADICRVCLPPEGRHIGSRDGTFLMGGFLFFDEVQGTSKLNMLRTRAGGRAAEIPPPTGDAVIDSTRALAADVYGALLLPTDAPHSFLSLANRGSPLEEAVRTAIREDPRLRLAAGEERGLRASTGEGGGTGLESLGRKMVEHAWDLVCLKEPVPSADDLLREVPGAVAAVRAAFAGDKVAAVGLASLTGVRLPDGCEPVFTWGRLRNARPGDRPPWTRRVVEYHEDYAGVALEAAVPFEVRVSTGRERIDKPPDPSGRRELEARIFQVRFALLLAWAGDDPLLALPVWQRFIQPLVYRHWPQTHRDVLDRLPATQVELTPEQATAWSTWIERLDAIPFRRLGVAPQRLMRACAERSDASDSLVDAVIAWEALFGTDTEVTFRVSGALARLLRREGEDRRKLRTRLSDIYRLRSKIVHGVEVDQQEIARAGKDAIRFATDALRVLIADRPDLIPLTSSERSTAILME